MITAHSVAKHEHDPEDGGSFLMLLNVVKSFCLSCNVAYSYDDSYGKLTQCMTERYAMDVLMYIIIHEWKVSSKALLIAISIYKLRDWITY